MSTEATSEKTWSAERPSRAVLDINVDMTRNREWEQWVLLTSDRHHDNPKTKRELEYAHLAECRQRNGLTFDAGDFFCAMQGKYDKRSDKSSVREEHQVNDYLDALVRTTVDDFAPYADMMAGVARGNHEDSILKNHETDLIERFTQSISDKSGSKVHSMGYTGWVRFRFFDGPFRKTVKLWYTHGYGGGGPVTLGTIQHNRKQIYLPDADIILGGHIHERWTLERARLRLTDAGRTVHDFVTHITNPTYKEEYGDGFGGWHISRGGPPKPVGATWLRFFWSPRHGDIHYEITPAR